MGWTDERVIGWDLETTSADVETARIVQYAFSEWEGGWKRVTGVYLVNPGIPIPSEASGIHGITDEMVRSAIPHEQAVDHIVGNLIAMATDGVPVVGMNLCFDLTIADRHWRAQTGDETLAKYLPPVIDILVMDKHFDQYRKGSRKLSAMAEHYGVEVHDAHDAGADAEMSVAVALKMAAEFGIAGGVKLGDADLAKLHELQIGWHRGQMVSLDEYFRSKGKPRLDMPADGDWPVKRKPETDGPGLEVFTRAQLDEAVAGAYGQGKRDGRAEAIGVDG